MHTELAKAFNVVVIHRGFDSKVTSENQEETMIEVNGFGKVLFKDMVSIIPRGIQSETIYKIYANNYKNRCILKWFAELISYANPTHIIYEKPIVFH